MNLPMSKENYSFLSEYRIHYNSDFMDDRLFMKEKKSKCGFGYGKSLESLKLLKKDGYENVVSYIQKELGTLYHDLENEIQLSAIYQLNHYRTSTRRIQIITHIRCTTHTVKRDFFRLQKSCGNLWIW
jgi:hypothetical protein